MTVKNNELLVTIVTPSYNQGQFIDETIQSVLNQTYKNIEYIVVDGNSTDDTTNVLDKYRSKIHKIIQEDDEGQTDAINKGFKLARGVLVGWVNSDDILYPDCVEKIVSLYLDNPSGSIFYPIKLDHIGATSKVFKTTQLVIPNRKTLLYNNYNLHQMGSFYKRSTVEKVGFLNKKIHYCMDLDLWLRLLEYGGIYMYKDSPISAFRRWEETKTSGGGKVFLKDIKNTLRVNNSPLITRNMARIYWYSFKSFIKNIFISKGLKIS